MSDKDVWRHDCGIPDHFGQHHFRGGPSTTQPGWCIDMARSLPKLGSSEGGLEPLGNKPSNSAAEHPKSRVWSLDTLPEGPGPYFS